MKGEFTVCLSHDVDRIKKTYQFFTHFLKSLKNAEIKSALYQVHSLFQRSHYWNFYKIMELEEQLGVKSTFFFLNETYPFNPLRASSWRLSLGYYNFIDNNLQRIIRELDNHGWEIGLHGSYLSFRDEELLKKEKSELESILEHPVLGVRQHYLNLDQHTWTRQAEAGFLYDASFGYTRDIGFKDDIFYPFEPLPNRHFYVMPLALMDGCVIRKNNPLSEAIHVIELAVEKRACLVLNWHQERFNEKEFPGWMALYLRLIDECRSRKAHFTTIGEYIRGIS